MEIATKLVPHRTAIDTLRPVLAELGLTVRAANESKGTLQLDPCELADVALRDLSRVFLTKLGYGAHLEVYRGGGYVCYAFLAEVSTANKRKYTAEAQHGAGILLITVNASDMDEAIEEANRYLKLKDPSRNWRVLSVREGVGA